MKLAGQYRMVLTRDGEVTKDTDWFDNMVLDQGLDYIGTSLSPSSGVFVNLTPQLSIGTGTTAVAAGQTALVAFTAAHNQTGVTTTTNVGSPTYASQNDNVYVFAQGAVVGNMAEVGVGLATGNGTGLFSRALIVDGSGTPTTLTVTSFDQLTVYYRLTVTPSVSDATGSVTLNSISYGWTGRIAVAGSWRFDIHDLQVGNVQVQSVKGSDAALGAITGNLTGTSLTIGGISGTPSYTPGNYYIDQTFVFAPSDAVDAGGIGGMQFIYMQGYELYQYLFATPIPKLNTQTLTLVFRYSWSR
jgi:hypothetical protein